MSQPRTLRITLEFEQGADPLRGRLLAGQAIYPFTGWLGPAAAHERALGAGAPPSTGRPAAGG